MLEWSDLGDAFWDRIRMGAVLFYLECLWMEDTTGFSSRPSDFFASMEGMM